MLARRRQEVGRVESVELRPGGPGIFVHINAFPRDAGRPQVNHRVSFEIELGPRGKRARNVKWIGPAPPVIKRVERNSQNQPGTGTLVVIPAFVIVYVVVGLLWEPPLLFALVYLLASLVTYLVYAMDKSYAERGEWRTPEGTLHVLSLAGGWPGALLAQQVLRHKSTKAKFRADFWATVVLNVAAFLVLSSPQARAFLIALR